MPRILATAIVYAASCGLLAGAASAADEAEKPDALGPCRADVERLCQDRPGDSALQVLACLKQHRSELSEECQEATLSDKERQRLAFARFHQACKADIAQHCPEIRAPGRLVQCLRRQEELSDACQSALPQRKPQP